MSSLGKLKHLLAYTIIISAAGSQMLNAGFWDKAKKGVKSATQTVTSTAVKIKDTTVSAAEKVKDTAQDLLDKANPLHDEVGPNPVTKVDYSTVLDKPFNEVVFACAHNGGSDKSGNKSTLFISVRNQEKSISEQLNNGIRGIKLPVFKHSDKAVVCHGLNPYALEDVKEIVDKKIPGGISKAAKPVVYSILPDPFLDIYYAPEKAKQKPCFIDPAAKDLTNILTDVRTFLEKNPKEFVTLFMEIWYENKDEGAADIWKNCQATGVDKYVHKQDPNKPWPTLNELIKADKRLILFSNKVVNKELYPYCEYDRDASWSSPYNYDKDAALKNDPAVKKPSTEWHKKPARTWVLQHFITIRTGGNKDEAAKVNKKEVIIERVNKYMKNHNLPKPTFIWVDFFNRPSTNGVMDAINELNKTSIAPVAG